MKGFLVSCLLLLFASVASAAFTWNGASITTWNGAAVTAWDGVSSGTSDGAIGTITHSTTRDTGAADTAYFSTFTTTAAGTVRYAHIYVADGNNNTLCVSLYDSSGNVLLNGSAAAGNNTAGWINIDMGSTYNIVASTTYWLGFQASTSTVTSIGVSSGTGDIRKDSSHSYSCGSTIANDAQETSGGQITILFNNTAGSPE